MVSRSKSGQGRNSLYLEVLYSGSHLIFYGIFKRGNVYYKHLLFTVWPALCFIGAAQWSSQQHRRESINTHFTENEQHQERKVPKPIVGNDPAASLRQVEKTLLSAKPCTAGTLSGLFVRESHFVLSFRC